MQDTDSYKWLSWQQYLTILIFEDRVKIPTQTYQNTQRCDQYIERDSHIGGIGWKRPSIVVLGLNVNI